MKFIIIVIMLFLSGCIIHQPDEPYMEFDPNEIILNGKVNSKVIINKNDVKKRTQTRETNNNIELTLASVQSAGAGKIMMPYYYDKNSWSVQTEYDVKLNTGKTINIFNYYSGFLIGECVKVFISENWEKYPPRMSSGGYC